MDVVTNPEEKVTCPYNVAHYILKPRMDSHLKKCRLNFKESEVIAICDFNKTHRVPAPELQYHHGVCPDRKVLELQVYTEESTFTPAIGTLVPSRPPPVDESWDEEVTESYDPQKYCENNPVLRRLDTASAAKRRDFMYMERQRLNNLLSEAAGPGGDADRIVAQRKPNQGRKPNKMQSTLPPLPSLPQPGAGDAEFSLMDRLTQLPRQAVIPKTKGQP